MKKLIDSYNGIVHNTVMKGYQIVLDSNVLVTALRSRLGASYKLLTLIDCGKFQFHLSVPLLFEYESVLKRDVKNSELSMEEIDSILDYLCQLSSRHKISYLWRPYLKDPKDDFILELAVEAGCDFIITYNKKDFFGVEFFNIKILSPKEFLQKIGELP